MLNDISYGIIVLKMINGVEHVLLVNRPGIDGYDLPKGHADEGESTLDAAKREVGEETGYWDVRVGNEIAIHINYPITKNGKEVNKEVFFYCGIHESEEVPTPKHDPNCEREDGMVASWIPTHLVDSLVKFPPMKQAIDVRLYRI